MTTISSIRKQIAALEKKAQDLIKKESAQAIAKVKEIIAEYGLTAEDLGLDGRGAKKLRGSALSGRAKKARPQKAPGAAMYRDPETGKTWTGRGKPPNWIAGLADRTPFLIATQDQRTVPAKSTRAPKKATTKSESRATGKERETANKRVARNSAKGASAERAASRSSAKTSSNRKAAAKKAPEPTSSTVASGIASAL